MFNFDFYNPTQILFGQGQSAAIGQLVPLGARVLMTYGGGSIRKNGVYDEVRGALAGHTVIEFGGIETNPSYETLMEAVALVKQEKIDFLLAVGGGSVIDGTKFIAAAALYKGEPWELLENNGKTIEAALPFATVLTLPATGSEMNGSAVITREATREKRWFASRKVYPVFSVLDPSTTFTLPLRQVGNGVIEAFAHVMEQYLTYPVNSALQDRFAEGILQTLIEEGPRALANPDDYDVRANVMLSATLAMNGLIGAGVPQDWSAHAIGHQLTSLYELDHAQTMAILLPSMMRVRRDAKRARLLQYAARIWNLDGGDENGRIEGAIVRTEFFIRHMGLKTSLADYGLDHGSIEAVLTALEAHGMTAMGEQRDVTLEVSRKVLEMSL
ncbi:iron-containing alcohol dehydrogenase [Janthinobacterium aquaticum]|uniref:iron-containing alcohol dehydrogenase n=1 Tax=Janthinobacterium sp. FT58W TaxID=2654254 RepID=UPI001264AC81|nr:iron-containing alcohol dehydrogenase [Janthinobacterium sp. FT58W]KAB8045365.1 iron-containing alcohol dehydrogenase [Janthinobacterium sp. FT58W]